MSEISLLQKEIILVKEQEILKAMEKSDLKKMQELIHDDLIFTIPNGQIITKEMDLETYSSGNMKIDKIEAEDPIVKFVGDNAMVSVIVKMTGSFLQQPFNGKFRVLRIWKEIGKEWKIIAGSSIQI